MRLACSNSNSSSRTMTRRRRHPRMSPCYRRCYSCYRFCRRRWQGEHVTARATGCHACFNSQRLGWRAENLKMIGKELKKKKVRRPPREREVYLRMGIRRKTSSFVLFLNLKKEKKRKKIGGEFLGGEGEGVGRQLEYWKGRKEKKGAKKTPPPLFFEPLPFAFYECMCEIMGGIKKGKYFTYDISIYVCEWFFFFLFKASPLHMWWEGMMVCVCLYVCARVCGCGCVSVVCVGGGGGGRREGRNAFLHFYYSSFFFSFFSFFSSLNKRRDAF